MNSIKEQLYREDHTNQNHQVLFHGAKSIADNRMFQIIDTFIEGEITDEQCRHCLSATNLGYQYVFKTEKALSQIKLLERCYLCQYEKEMYKSKRQQDNKVSEDKVKLARKQYRGQGHYIDEILV